MAHTVEAILKLRKRVKKAKHSTDELLDILNVLKQSQITRRVLEQTGIGKTVAKLSSKNKHEGVRSVANELLKEWKSIASREKKSDAKVDGNGSAAILPADDLRKRVCTMLLKEFQDAGFSDSTRLSVCVAIEKAMYLKFDKNTQSKEYKGKFRSLKFNLGKNSEIRGKLLQGKVTAGAVVDMKASELASSEKQKERKELLDMEGEKCRSDYMDANRDKINEQAGIDKVGGLITCEECKSTKTTHYQKQTRGADEPMTVFAQCTDCGHNWRFGDH